MDFYYGFSNIDPGIGAKLNIWTSKSTCQNAPILPPLPEQPRQIYFSDLPNTEGRKKLPVTCTSTREPGPGFPAESIMKPGGEP